MGRPRPLTQAPPVPVRMERRRRGRLTVAAFLAVGVGWAILLQETTTSPESDPFESPWYLWSWLLLPALGGLAALVVGPARPFLWAAAMVGPFAVLVALEGTVWWDSADGASFWLIGEIFVGLHLLLIAVVTSIVGARRTPA